MTSVSNAVAYDKDSHTGEMLQTGLKLPRHEGMAALRQIRALAAYPDTPILVLTANTFAEDGAICQEAGMIDFPASPSTLINCLQACSSA